MVEEKVEAPERLWVQIYRHSFAAYDSDPREVHDNGKPVYEYVPAAPNTRQRAERAARNLLRLVGEYNDYAGNEIDLPPVPRATDIIAAEFEK